MFKLWLEELEIQAGGSISPTTQEEKKQAQVKKVSIQQTTPRKPKPLAPPESMIANSIA